MNILISAYAVSPSHGSEPGLGWNWIIQISKFATVHVITEIEFKDEIELTISKLELNRRVFFYYIDIGSNARKMCWNQGDWRFYFYYRKWQIKAYRLAQKIISKTQIDLIHQLNMIGFREPGFLWRIPGIPFIWGPVGGFNIINLKYLYNYSLKTKLFYLIKNLLNYIQMFFSIRVRNAATSAKIVLSATTEMKNIFYNFYRINSIVLNETGADFNQLQPDEIIENDNNFNILWVGRFIPTKLLFFALNIISKISDLPNIKFHIVGCGNSESDLLEAKTLSKRYGIESLCVWHGRVSHKNVQQIMKKSQLLLFTSIVEGTSHVVIESINNKLPVFCFNTCGHGEIVSEDIGCKVDLTSPHESLDKFATLIRYYYNNPRKLNSLSENCSNKAEQISWSIKGSTIEKFYKMTHNQ